MQNRIKQNSVISSLKRCFSYQQFDLLAHREGNTKRSMMSILPPSEIAFNTKFMSKHLTFQFNFFIFTLRIKNI